MYVVVCGNPYFKGQLAGVLFRQHAGGGRGEATREEALRILYPDGPDGEVEENENFRCPALQAELAMEAEAEREEPPAEEPQLIEVNGIGPVTAERLAGSGIETLAHLIAADAEALDDLDGIGAEEAADWQRQAQALRSRLETAA